VNRQEFLLELRRKLKHLPPLEVENAILYYDEYFNEAGPENEQRVISELGSPAAVAARIIGEYAVNDAEASRAVPAREKRVNPFWVAVIAVCASPLALPLLIVLFALLISLFSVLFSFAAAGVAIAASGVAVFFAGFWVLVQHSAVAGVVCIGTGLFLAAGGTAALIGTVKLTQYTVWGIQRSIGKLLIKRGAKV